MRDIPMMIIDMGKLYPLGVTESHIQLAVSFLAIIIFYYCLRPMIRWLMYLEWNKVITYVVGSLFLLCVFALVELYQGVYETGNMSFTDLANALSGIVVFGFFLFIIHSISSLVQHIKVKNKKNTQQRQMKTQKT
ncbi:hypothetical protein [Salinibacillus xinjiangensis]|uniref:Uncharacterized protein n=1 Tax=Salinibacillus xinjiangensis TaxID=1229268 RepID=A0A6G1X3U9_9BACI|nr:hypothetical protein [Salinibacillus xinjiangensis]MRG85585.1 hypothetical protein [Salinibacillus xinjiangensis]